jgi:hypothetical protein
MVDDGLDAAVGSVAEEAARLIESLRRQVSAAGTAPDPEPPDEPPAEPQGHEPQGHEPHEHSHVPMGEAQTCTYCPVCRAVVLLRQTSPETLDRLADLARGVATLLTDVAAMRTTDEPAGAAHPARTEPITVVDEED